jgi:hypothetical protein
MQRQPYLACFAAAIFEQCYDIIRMYREDHIVIGDKGRVVHGPLLID